MASKKLFCPAAVSAATLPSCDRLVGEHRLADDVADGEDVRHVGAHLLVHRDEAALVHLHAGILRADQAPVRLAPDGDQHAVEHVAGRGLAALEMHGDAVRASASTFVTLVLR